ncbi:Rpn family recombination-promoting nuclease/putative transposase [Thiocapsa sp.]|uniref:Rpn family recombination-promoting nuclease/putative transposase n=1 Tax=Thiocapsa sp. TaxID=2024551 RepID=UPI003593F342
MRPALLHPVFVTSAIVARGEDGYKRLFSHPEMIRDLLVGFVREPWIADLDFASLETYRGEFIDDRLQQRRNDVIWRLRLGPDWFYVYVLLEFQSGVHPFMAARLSTYLDLLYQDLFRAGNSDAADACRRCCPSSSIMDGDTGPPPPTWPI